MQVRVANVRKEFDTFPALHDVSLEVRSGELIALLGPSGSGKTTLLRLIAGLEQPTTGRIFFGDEDASAKSIRERNVGFVFQHYALFRHMTVADNIGFGLKVRPADTRPASAEIRKRATDLLDLVQLSGLEKRYPAQLSGGQRQRVAMARALVRRPRVLLLDEPLSALDVKLREGMQGELKRLHRDLGITFLMVTHDQNEALALSDRIVVMNRGRIAQIGTPGELYDAPANPHVADFIGSTNLVPAELAGSDGGTLVFRLANGASLRSTRKAPSSLAPGGRVILGLRPERLLPAGADAANTLDCTLRESLFRGERQRLELGLDGIERPLFAELPRVALPTVDTLAPGERVAFAINPADVLILVDEDGA